MPGRAMRHHMEVVAHVGPIGERPEYRVGVARVDVLAHRDDNLAAIGLENGGAVEPTPDLALRRTGGELEKDDGTDIAERFVEYDLADALDGQGVAQMG